MANNLLSVEAVNIRDYANNKHNRVDDYPYGGGAGMLMQAEPVYGAYRAVEDSIQERTGKEGRTRVVYLSPQGGTFSQSMAEEFAKEEDLILLCGHYEGIDERVLEEIVTDYVSIGDYVQDQKSGMTSECRRSFYPDIMPTWKSGEENSRF